MRGKRRYVVKAASPGQARSLDGSPVYYCHLDGFPNVPVFGSIGSRQKAVKVCRMMNKGR